MDWFRHDVNAHDDTKIRKLVYKHGVSAYGAYWIIIELLYKNEGKASDQEVEDEFELMAVEGLKEAFEKSGLFDISEDGTWTSNRVTEEICFQNEARLKRANAGRLGGLAKASNAKAMVSNAKAEPSNALANPSTIPNLTLPSNKPLSVSKETSSPIGKSVSPKTPSFQKPTLEEVKAYCKERNNSVNAEDFINYYDSVGWIVGKGKRMKDWKASVRTWEKDTKTPAPRKDLSDIGVQKVTKIDWGV